MNATELREAFDAPEPMTIGLEEEAMLLDPATADLAPVAAEVIARATELRGADSREGAADDRAARALATVAAPRAILPKRELPASQIELTTAPAATVAEAIAQLGRGRRALAAAAEGLALPAAAGMHPFAAPLGELSEGDRYDAILAEYGDVARSQLVCSLQVHVAVGGADRTLAVYNALRGHVPELAALAANAPFLGGRDSGLASVRPLVSGLLPRQGVPPALESWEAFADALSWGRAAGAVPEPRRWWWELRPHVAYGTLELRVPDAQTTLSDAAAVAAFAHALIAWLAERHDAGEPLPAPASWRIAENRWTACRFGLDGELADLRTGERTPVRRVLLERLAQLASSAERLGCAAELASAGALIEANGAQRQRELGPVLAARRLAELYLE
ncbi:carboxylate-amine ligase [Candidatus Solirubrobacter pratensis]|uniref:carboxylate-amine ligase n=1 Tax=Candidatus Solirubrobacter pratensis TaxID=1298857 RepID=UPI000406B02A|nr:YbdK family carboxylate-amine ligase [Candidatus Solirubrobacter pratensis]